MAAEPLVFALDIGTRTIVGLVLTADAHGYRIKAAQIEEHETRSMFQGQIHDIEAVAGVVRRVKEKLGLTHVRVVGNPEQRVLRAAVCGGSGGSFLRDAIKQKAHVFITGDVKYHDAALAMEAGIGIIDAGHWGTEKMLVSALAEYLQEELAARQAGVEVVCHHTRELFQVI